MREGLLRAAVLVILVFSALALAMAPLAMPPGYSWISMTTSESAAQATEGAWVARLGFLLFGLAVLLLSVIRTRWGPWATGFHVVFGVMMIAAAVFSHRPWDPAIAFDRIEDLAHSVAATVLGFAFAFGVLVVALRRATGDRWLRALDVAAILSSVALPLAMMQLESGTGVFQRIMFGFAYVWYGVEATDESSERMRASKAWGLRRFIIAHPLVWYFTLAYGISWLAILTIVGVDGLRTGNLGITTGLLVWLSMLAGPGIAGISLTWLVSGRVGLRELRSSMLRWRVPARWYVMLGVAPTAGVMTGGALSMISADYHPMLVTEPKKTVIVIMFFVLILGAVIEELGWTGFATPRMLKLYGMAGTGLLLGLLHGFWHFLADFSGRGDVSTLLYALTFLVFWVLALVTLRFLIVWVYQHTESLLLGQLIHASYTAPLFILSPTNASAEQMLIMWTLFTIVFAVTVAIVMRSGSIAGRLQEGPGV